MQALGAGGVVSLGMSEAAGGSIDRIGSGSTVSTVKRFADPPGSSRPSMLWFWTGDVTEADITDQLEDMNSVGIDEFILFPEFADAPLQPPFFTEQWFELVGHTVNEAKRLGMRMWLFNDDHYPSGRGGGFVTGGVELGSREYSPRPDLAAKTLDRSSSRISGPGEIDVAELIDSTPPVSIQDGRLRMETVPGDVIHLDRGFDWTDYRVSFDTKPLEADGYAQAGWVFRAQDTDDLYIWLIGNYPHSGAEGGNITKLAVKDGERQYVEIEPLPFDIHTGEWYHVETELDGETIVTYVDGVEVDRVTDDIHAAGTVGFRQGSEEVALFDDLRVEAFDGTVLFEETFDDEAALDAFVVPPSATKSDLVRAVALPLEDGTPRIDDVVDLTENATAGESWSAPADEFLIEGYFEIVANAGHVDPLRTEAVERYVDIIHGEYYRRFGDEFGETIRGFWDDESNIQGDPPWSPELEATLDDLDHTLVEVLPALFHDSDDLASDLEGIYTQAVSTRFSEAYYRVQGEWAEQRDIEMISNPEDDHTGPADPVYNSGDLLKSNTWFQVPGGDAVHGESLGVLPGGRLLAPRYQSSAAHQMGRDRVVAENLGAYGWGTTLETARYVHGYMATNGANLTFLHAYWSHSRVNAPPPIQPMNPLWSVLDDHVEWLGRVMEVNRGQPLLETALIVPQRAAERSEHGADLDEDFESTVFALEDVQVDFDMVGESSLDGDPGMRLHASPEGGRLEVGEQTYRYVILPPTPVLSLETVETLLEFVRGGGTVAALGELPTEEAQGRDESLQSALEKLFETDDRPGSGTAVFVENVDALEAFLNDTGAPAATITPNESAEQITVIRRKYGDEHLFVLMNEGLTPVDADVIFDIPDAVSGTPSVWDPNTGTIRTLWEFHETDAGTSVPLRIDPFDVTIIGFSSHDGAQEPSQVPHVIESDSRIDVRNVENVSGGKGGGGQRLSADIRVDEAGSFNLSGKHGGRVFWDEFDVDGSFEPVETEGPWTFYFEGEEADKRAVSLGSWTDIDAEFSGTGVYEAAVTLGESDLSKYQYTLDLGKVRDIAAVTVNGVDIGMDTARPYRFDVTDALIAGKNDVRVEVTNTIANRKGQPQPSGLFGPVQLEPYEQIETTLEHEPGGRAVDVSLSRAEMTLPQDDTKTVTARVENLLRRPSEGELTASGEGAVSVSPNTTSVTVSGFETTEVELSVIASASAAAGNYDVTVSFDDLDEETLTVSIPEPPEILEDFEDGALSEYGGDTHRFGVQSDTVFDGSNAMTSPGASPVASISRTDVSLRQGDTVSARINFGSSTDVINPGLFVFTQQESREPDGYLVEVANDHSPTKFRLWRNSGGFTQLATDEFELQLDTWYEIVVEAGETGQWTVTLNDDEGVQVAQVTAADSTFTSGGFGWRMVREGTAYYDYVRK
jgi:hypothetical protein